MWAEPYGADFPEDEELRLQGRLPRVHPGRRRRPTRDIISNAKAATSILRPRSLFPYRIRQLFTPDAIQSARTSHWNGEPFRLCISTTNVRRAWPAAHWSRGAAVSLAARRACPARRQRLSAKGPCRVGLIMWQVLLMARLRRGTWTEDVGDRRTRLIPRSW